MNNLSRNKPICLVVGAAGFIGSHLTEELLENNIQVVGVDDLSTGFRDNLIEAGKDKNFELISGDFNTFKGIKLPRLDYAVFVITESGNSIKYRETLKGFIDYCKELKPKIVLASTIDLYDSEKKSCENIKFAENFLAKEASGNKINARVIRLSAVFGPRMHFRESDPVIRLIKSAVSGKLNKEAAPLEFTTRAIYIKDAVTLLIKTLMHGSTSQKIYDGAALSPIKVSEIKQVLLDPLWYEEKGFTPTLLPPWLTPNLNKTFKELSFKPKEDIVKGLKETLNYFNSHKDKIPAEDIKKEVVSEEKEKEAKSKTEDETEDKKPKKNYSLPKVETKNLKSKILIIAGAVLIFYVLVFPFLKLGYLGWAAKNHFENSLNQLAKGDFENAKFESNMAVNSIQSLNNSLEKAVFINNIGIFKKPYQETMQALDIFGKTAEANEHIVNGAQSLSAGLAIVSGEKEGDSLKNFTDAKVELETANSGIGVVTANLSAGPFFNNLPGFLKDIFGDLDNKLKSSRETIILGQSLADLMPEIIAPDGQKNYLVVLQDNRILRPGGGQLKAYAVITFDHGRLSKIKSDTIENLDRQFGDKIEPPLELKSDLGETNWRLRDGSYDMDFPTGARNIAWFFNKESGEKVFGVIAIDFEGAAKLLKVMDPSGKSNLLTNISLSRDGNQQSSAVLKNLIEKFFYLSKQNWIDLAKNSGESLNQKHLLIYLSDPNVFSYLSSNGWSGKIDMPALVTIGARNEFLAFSETNMSSGQDSTAIERKSFLLSGIDDSGMVSHKLAVDFTSTNRLSGKYKNRFKVYLPAKTKMIRATWGGVLIKDMNPFSDYGLAGFSMLLELNPGEEKQLIMEYQDSDSVKFKDKELKFSLSVEKQPSQEAIPFEFKLSFPTSYKAETDLRLGLGEVSAKTDLSRDKNFQIILKQ